MDYTDGSRDCNLRIQHGSCLPYFEGEHKTCSAVGTIHIIATDFSSLNLFFNNIDCLLFPYFTINIFQ